MKNKLAGTLGNEQAEELVSYTDERTSQEYGEERASIKGTLQEIVKRLDRIENRVDTLHAAHIGLIRWMMGIGLTVVGLTVTLVKLL